MKKLSELLEKRWFSYTVAICAGVLFFMILSNISVLGAGLSKLWGIIKPIVIGAVIAYLLNPIMVFFETKFFYKLNEKVAHMISVILAFLVTLLVLGVLLGLVIPSVIDSVMTIYKNFNQYQAALINSLDWLEANIGVDTGSVIEKVEKAIGNFSNIFDIVYNNYKQVLSTTTSVGYGVFNAVIGVILAIYFLIGKKGILSAIAHFRESFTMQATLKKQNDFLSRCHTILIAYIGCDLLDAAIIGILNAIIMLIFKVPFVPLISIIVGVTNLIPTFGPFIGGALGGLILLFVNPVACLIFLITTLVLQTFDGYLLKPKLFGSLLGVPSVLVLVAILVGGGLFGVLGILLSIPAAAILTFIYNEALIPALVRAREKREKEKKKAQG